MKITTLILLTTLLQVSAASIAQKVTLSKKNVPLTEVFKEIKKQTGFTVLISSKALNKSKAVSIDLKDVQLDYALAQVLKGQNLNFVIKDKAVVIKENLLQATTFPIASFTDILGVVLDEKGNPLPGASVKVKGTNSSVTTNENGQFRLTGVNVGDILLISYVGYGNRESVVSQSNNVVVRLELAEAELDGVTVVSTGYQNLPKERATGSFKTISKEQLDKPATTLAQRLVGTTAGMASIVDADGNTTFRVRGLTSLSANANPLIVVDGFPIQGNFDNINPNNIESVTILKDAAAASIWGARSANGVIVITTKSGKGGVPFAADVTAFTRVGNMMDIDYARPLASSSETVDYEVYAFGKWAPSSVNGGALTEVTRGTWSQAMALMNEQKLGRITAAQRDAALERLRGLDNRDQIRDLILANPISNQVNVNMSGSTKRMNNAASILYEANQSDFQGNDNKRSLINYKSDAKVLNWLDFDMALMLQYQKSNRNGFSLGDIQGWSPYDMILNDDGSQTHLPFGYYMPTVDLLIPTDKFPYDFYYNPVRERNARDFTTENINARIQGGLTVKPFKGLSISSRIQYENFNTFNRDLSAEDAFTVRSSINNSLTWNRLATGAVTLNLPKGAQLNQSRTKMRGYTWRNQINFNRDIAQDHSINFIAGAEIRSSVTEGFTNPTAYGYNDETLATTQFPNGPGGSGTRAITNWLGNNVTFPYTNSFSYFTDRYFSSFANLGYTFKNKYTISGSFRTDASNLIAEDPAYRYSPFWSVGGSWQASRESFLQDVSWLDKLTTRVTYGYNGNEDRSTSPLPLISLSANPNGNTGTTTATISSYGNPGLRWEKTGTINLGIDFSIFKGKLYGTIEGYNKKGKDLLANIAIPVVNGTTTQKLNNVKMYNRGIELELGSNMKINDFIAWRGNVNFAYNENQITKLFMTQYTASNLTESGVSAAYLQGQNANTVWSYDYLGFINGRPMYSGPGGAQIDLSVTSPSNDANLWLRNSGVTVAPYTLGLVNAFDVKDFTLSFIMTGKFGHVFRRSSFNYPYQNGFKTLPNARLSEVLNGDPAQILTLPTDPNDASYKTWSRYRFLDYLVTNANHIRFQEISLSYNVNPAFMRKLKLSGLRLYAQGNDLLTITNNHYDEDPEYLLGSINPTPRYTFGLRLQL
ncbi:SusC/RagA family TonB-linked outer membrane protein [Pedobacter sp. PWIIR3]